jgi:hypothetical protein
MLVLLIKSSVQSMPLNGVLPAFKKMLSTGCWQFWWVVFLAVPGQLRWESELLSLSLGDSY